MYKKTVLKMKKIGKSVFSLCFLACSSLAFGRGEQELVDAGHWVYESVEKLCMESGIVNFSDSAPVSISELKLYLKEIDFSSLSEAGQAEYKKIQDYFNYEPFGLKSDLIKLGFEPSINISAFYKTDDDIDWVYDRYQRSPFIAVPLSLQVSDFISMKMDLALRMNKNNAVKDDVYSNIPFSADAIDINFPDNAWFSAGKKIGDKTGISFLIGQGAKNIGRSLTGSIIWSEYFTGSTNAQFSVYSPNIKYTALVSQFNVDKYMYLHQLDLRFFKKLAFTVLEGVMVNAPLELRYLNPLTVFHGMAPWREYDGLSYDSESHTGAYLGLKFQFAPVENLKFYGLYAMTQFQTSYETSNYPDDSTPNGIGGQLGGRYTLPLSKGRFTFSLEGSYAQPYLYIKESPNWSLVRTYAENMGSKKYPFYEWVGSPFGPDTISAELEAGYEVPDRWAVNLVYLFMARGEMSGTNVFDTMIDPATGKYLWGGVYTGHDYPDGWCYPGIEIDDKAEGKTDEEKRNKTDSSVFPDKTAKQLQSLVTPTGTPEFVHRVSLRGTYRFSSSVEGVVQPSFVYILNKGHQHGKTACGVEVAGGCSIKF